MNTIKASITIFPAFFLLFIWIGLTSDLVLPPMHLYTSVTGMAAVSAFSLTRFLQEILKQR